MSSLTTNNDDDDDDDTGFDALYLKKLNTKLLLPTMRAEADALSKKYAQWIVLEPDVFKKI